MIYQRLVETVAQVQELSGCAPVAIDATTCPLCDLNEFDSLRGVEATVLLAAKLNCEFKTGKSDVNLFVSKDGRRALTINEIVDRLVELSN